MSANRMDRSSEVVTCGCCAAQWHWWSAEEISLAWRGDMPDWSKIRGPSGWSAGDEMQSQPPCRIIVYMSVKSAAAKASLCGEGGMRWFYTSVGLHVVLSLYMVFIHG